ncbi:MAG: glycosyltransferase [Bacteroidales bacterium]|nr:glycosyltransferase [Bacteroidales bacterium]
MISFIVIGRNEGWKLSLCLESIYKTIEFNKINDFEIIYVDSKSTDDSIDRAKKFTDISIYEITGEYNAAIARNIGAKESKGNILFFIDGDVELQPDFIGNVISPDQKRLKHDCLAGYIEHMYYDVSWKFINRAIEGVKGSIPDKEIKRAVNGGIFLMKRAAWELVNGMKTKYRKNQDLDLALRLSGQGIYFIRVPYLMGLHHTIDYRNENRMWKIMFSDYLKFPAVTVRDHIMNIEKLKHTARRQYTAIILLISVISLLFSITAFKFFISFYLLMVIIKSLMNTMKAATSETSKIFYYFMRIGYQLMSDTIFWYGFFTFFPREKELVYEKIQG